MTEREKHFFLYGLFMGERDPVSDDDETAIVRAMCVESGPAEFYRSANEVGDELRELLEAGGVRLNPRIRQS